MEDNLLNLNYKCCSKDIKIMVDLSEERVQGDSIGTVLWRRVGDLEKRVLEERHGGWNL